MLQSERILSDGNQGTVNMFLSGWEMWKSFNDSSGTSVVLGTNNVCNLNDLDSSLKHNHTKSLCNVCVFRLL